MSPIRQQDLLTARLRLRPFEATDTDAVRALANDVELARNTLNLPHPYEVDHARDWIASHPGQLEREEAVTFAVTLREGGALVGAVGLILELENERAELGYWIGREQWGRGYATEAAGAVVGWGFEALGLHRIYASHFPRNPASGRVLRKLGMRHEGRLREHIKKWGEFVDLERFGILRREYGPGGGAG